MGKRGPAPKPTNVRLLHGDRKDRINTAEPVAPEGLPSCPVDTPAVRAVWDYTVDVLSRMSLATPADRDALLAFCEAVVMHRRASQKLAAEEIVVPGLHGGMVRNPLVQIQRDQAMLIRVLGQQFGLTPSARSSIVVGGGAADGGAGAGRLLTG